MATEQISEMPFSVASVVEDVLQQHGTRLRDIDMASRKAEEASLRRYEAAEWLRKMVGVVGGKDLPAQPSEEEFRLGLRSGIILCNVLNKIHPGAVAKVAEGPCDSVIIPDGAPLSAFQYFENIRNFLVAAEELGIPCFEASDLEQGGKSARVVKCVLALKSYGDWKQAGGNGTWKYSGNSKPPAGGSGGKPFVRKNSEPFMNSFSRTSSSNSRADQLMGDDLGLDINETGATVTRTLSTLVRTLISNNKQEDVPNLVESMLNKVMEEFERRLSQNEVVRVATRDQAMSDAYSTVSRTPGDDTKEQSAQKIREEPAQKMEEESAQEMQEESAQKVEEESNEKIEEEAPVQSEARETGDQTDGSAKESERQLMKQKMLEGQQRKLMKQKQKMIEEQQRQLMKQKQNMLEEQQRQFMKQKMLVEQQKGHIQELKQSLHNARDGVQFLQMKYQEEFHNLGKHLYVLAHAASGYQRVLDENRKLYNQVQDLKGNIRVYCRVRPFLNGQPSRSSTVGHIEEGNITILTPPKYGKEGRKQFSFNKVFGPLATQAEVFSDTQPLIRSVLDGYNVCIFAYGQTGSGKTYTMSGPKELTEEGLGVNYRALSDLFLLSEQRKDVICYDISVQMLEIYNEQVRDLLAPDSSNRRLEIRNSSQNGINVPDACLVPVSSTADVINIMNTGQKNRAVTATAMNDRSSRSHSCLTVHVQGRNLTSGSVIRGSMHLVDLAGSERVDKSEVTGVGLKEATFINKSLSALGDVIASLAQKNSHVPYRNSKLTQLLQDSLGGQAKTLMFIHISPEPETLGETLSTLKFAERVATVELGAARVNKDSTEVKDLKEQIASLKAALAMKEGDTDNSQHSRSSTPEKFGAKAGMGNMSNGRRHLMDDVGDGEARNKPSISRRRSLDPQDLMMNSPPWPAQNGKDGDWVDKVVVNRHGIAGKDDDLLGQWEVDSRQLPDITLQNYSRDPSKIYTEQPFNKSLTSKKDSQEYDAQSRYDMASTDGSDELEVGTSDSSEPDLQWQSNIPRVASLPSTLGSKTKKSSNLRGPKTTETRSSIPSLIPSPSRKLPNGVSPAKPGRQAVQVDGKKKGAHAK